MSLRSLRTIALLAPLATSACQFGKRLEHLPSATTPVGATMFILPAANAPYSAELLAVEDSGLFVLAQGRLLFAPHAELTAATRVVGAASKPLGREWSYGRDGRPSDERLARLRLVSRFPQGLAPHVLDELLRLHGQDAVARQAPPPAGADGAGAAPTAPGAHAEHAPSTHAADLDAAQADFARRAREGTARFRDRRAAIVAGYRRLGADFPAMGEHWVNPGLAVSGRFDPARPAMLSYVVVAGTPRLAGVVYAVPLAPGERPPAIPDVPSRWHEHNGTVDEESLTPSHDAHGGHGDAASPADAPRVRLAILHAWTETANPAGLFATDNWSLPFVRAGLAPPASPDPLAARALALAGGAEPYYLRLLGAGAPLAPAADAEARAALDAARGEVAALLARSSGHALDAAELRALRDVWARVARRVAAAAGEAAAERLTGGA